MESDLFEKPSRRLYGRVYRRREAREGERRCPAPPRAPSPPCPCWKQVFPRSPRPADTVSVTAAAGRAADRRSQARGDGRGGGDADTDSPGPEGGKGPRRRRRRPLRPGRPLRSPPCPPGGAAARATAAAPTPPARGAGDGAARRFVTARRRGAGEAAVGWGVRVGFHVPEVRCRPRPASCPARKNHRQAATTAPEPPACAAARDAPGRTGSFEGASAARAEA